LPLNGSQHGAVLLACAFGSGTVIVRRVSGLPGFKTRTRFRILDDLLCDWNANSEARMRGTSSLNIELEAEPTPAEHTRQPDDADEADEAFDLKSRPGDDRQSIHFVLHTIKSQVIKRMREPPKNQQETRFIQKST